MQLLFMLPNLRLRPSTSLVGAVSGAYNQLGYFNRLICRVIFS